LLKDVRTVPAVEKIEFRAGSRPGEIAIADAKLGENPPGLLPIAAMVDDAGIHAYLLHVSCDNPTYS